MFAQSSAAPALITRPVPARTIAEFLPDFQRLHVSRMRRPDNVKYLLRHLAPMATIPFDEITETMVEDWHDAIGQSKGRNVANKALSLLKTIFLLARRRGLTRNIPTVGVRRFRVVPRSRYLSPETERQRFIQALAPEKPLLQAYFWIELITASRPAEVRYARWDRVDMALGLWTKCNRDGEPEMKNGKPHQIPLPGFILDLLEKLPHYGPYIFSTSCGRPLSQSSLHAAWDRVRARARLEGTQQRDLRRTAATWLEHRGTPITDVQQLLGHTTLKYTNTYVQPNPHRLSSLLERQAEWIRQVDDDPAQ